MEDWRHTCFSYFAKSKTGSKGETSHKLWSRCASVWIFLVDGVWNPLYGPSLLFFFLDKGLSFLSFLFLFFFDMPKHVTYLLWVCIFYLFFWHTEACGIPSLGMHLLLFFLHSPISFDVFLRESGVIRKHGVLFCGWMDVLLTSSVEA